MTTCTVSPFASLTRYNRLFVLLLTVFLANAPRAQYTLAPDILPSADATALGKYGQFPVSHYTGQAKVSIPLHTLEANGLTMDLTLDYDGSGIMVDVHPGWVGQNWTLNGVGVITRSVQGRADEEGFTKGGFYYNNRISYIEAVIAGQNWFTEENTDTYEELREFALDRLFLYHNPIDTEPDIFSFNFFGKTGKFFLGNDGNWKVISDHNLKVEFDYADTSKYMAPLFGFIPGTLNQKKYENVIPGFKITDEAGYVYTFGHHDAAVEQSLPFFRQYSGTSFFGDPDWVSTAWYLTKVEDHRGNEIYNLSYERSYFTAQVYEVHLTGCSSCRIANGNWLPCDDFMSRTGTGSLIGPVYLSSIETNKGDRLEFKRSTTVQKPFTWTNVFNFESNQILDNLPPPYPPFPFLQLPDYYSYDPENTFPNPFPGLMWMKLDTILVFQNDTHLVKAVNLSYNNDPDERLNLLNVDYVGNDLLSNPSTGRYGYSMIYDRFDELPDYFSRQIDHFGYHNGIL